MSVATFIQGAVQNKSKRLRLPLGNTLPWTGRNSFFPAPPQRPVRLPANRGLHIPQQNPLTPAGVAAAPSAPAAPKAPAAPSAPDVRDSQYWADFAGLRDQRTGLLSGLDRDQQYADQDRIDNIKRLTEQRAQSLSSTKKAANNRGLFYSTMLTNQDRDVEKGYGDQESMLQEAYRRAAAERSASKSDVLRRLGSGDTDLGSEGQRLLADAVARQMERDLAAPPPPAPVTPTQVAAQAVHKATTHAVHHQHALDLHKEKVKAKAKIGTVAGKKTSGLGSKAKTGKHV